MNIRWRLAIGAGQLLALLFLCYLATGHFFVTDAWFLAGLLSVVINPQLLEPYYPRPGDVIGNSIIFLILLVTAQKTFTSFGWYFFGGCFLIATLLAIVALLFGAGRRGTRYSGVANSARSLSQLASSRVIYSVVCLLSAVEIFPLSSISFWIVISGWIIILLFGKINWQAIWLSAHGREALCMTEGMIGPSTLLVSAPDLPDVGLSVTLVSPKVNALGVIVHRIRRISDTWGQILVADRTHCEALVVGQSITVARAPDLGSSPIGSAEQGSTDKILRFTALQDLEVGRVVCVPLGGEKPSILYQLSSASIDRTDVKGGANLIVRATANQLGVHSDADNRFHHYRWVPPPSALILQFGGAEKKEIAQLPADTIVLGEVIGTNIPILIDCNAVCEGHLAILGMTKMGKSTFATRLALELSKTRRVTILDQTGEYVSKKGLPSYDTSLDWKSPGISVFEPKPGEVSADRALSFLEFLIKIAVDEYKAGTPYPRVVIIDEAHQFIPEPAGLGFNAPGRDSSYKFGLLMMQIRKYGISVILVSQRTAVVAKSALSQCENLICFRSVDQTGLDYLEAIAGNDIRSLLPQLLQGEALAFGPAISADNPVAVRVVQ